MKIAVLAASRDIAAYFTSRPETLIPEPHILALGSGDIAVFRGRPKSGKPVVLVASPYIPFPLSHGGAVRIYNLTRRAAPDFDHVLVCFSPEMQPPAPEVLSIFCEAVLVRQRGSHLRRRTQRPDAIDDFDSVSYRAALRQTIRKHRPGIVQLEFTQMAQYAADCSPAHTVLVEHDITFDLYRQLATINDDWDTRLQLQRWQTFETEAWQHVDRVVVMSDKDALQVRHARAVTIANGVDLERFRPCGGEPEPRRILFIGSFGHLPNLLALDHFLRNIWPALFDLQPVLHVIAGNRPEYFRQHHSDRVTVNLEQPGIELDGFVSDVRGAYARAAVVIAPLVASAGTNIKIMEALAMGKPVVSTRPGVNGLDLGHEDGVLVQDDAQGFADSIRKLLLEPEFRQSCERRARSVAERKYDWDAVARAQQEMYMELLANPKTGHPFT